MYLNADLNAQPMLDAKCGEKRVGEHDSLTGSLIKRGRIGSVTLVMK